MEDPGGDRDEQQGGGPIVPSGSAIDDAEGNDLAEQAAGGDSRMNKSDVSDAGVAEGGMPITEEEEAVGPLEDGAVRDDEGEGAISDSDGVRANDERNLQPRSRSLQSTLQLGNAVEDDARAVARSLTDLLSSLKSALSEATGSALEHMRSENEAAGQLQDVAIDAATKGNRFINACLRLNEEMKGMNGLATQLESLKQRVDQFEYHSNRYLPRY